MHLKSKNLMHLKSAQNAIRINNTISLSSADNLYILIDLLKQKIFRFFFKPSYIYCFSDYYNTFFREKFKICTLTENAVKEE